jgi:hypothetical protein
VLSGCEGEYYFNCPDPVFGKIGYEDGLKLTCTEISERARLARDLMEDSKMYEDFTKEAPNVKLFVYNAHRGVAYYIGGSVDVDSEMASLVHEMLHIKDFNASGYPLDFQGGHADWDNNGRYAITSIYSYELYRLHQTGTRVFYCESFLPPSVKKNLMNAGWDLTSWYKMRASYCDL